MAFSLGVEIINMRASKARAAPLTLHHKFEYEAPGASSSR